MSEAEILAACEIKWQQFLADSKLSPAKMSDVDRMIFKAAFVYAAEWALSHVKQQQMLKRKREEQR